MLTKLQAVLVSRHHLALANLGKQTLLCSQILVLNQQSATPSGCHTQNRALSWSPACQNGHGHLLSRSVSEKKRCRPTAQILKLDHEHTSVRLASQSPRKTKQKDTASSKHIVESKDKPFSELTVGEKVAQAGKDATYTGIIIVGVGVTALMFFAIGRELFSGQSASGVYGKALKQIKRNGELVDELGEPIKGYGERTRRGRRRYTSNVEYMVDDVKHMRMKFYVEGPLRKGTAQLEVKKNESGKYEYRYLFVDLNGYPRKTIVLEDRR